MMQEAAHRGVAGTLADVSFQEVAQKMKPEAMAKHYGGDGSILSCAQALTFIDPTVATGGADRAHMTAS